MTHRQRILALRIQRRRDRKRALMAIAARYGAAWRKNTETLLQSLKDIHWAKVDKPPDGREFTLVAHDFMDFVREKRLCDCDATS